jgi:hypothetical protein
MNTLPVPALTLALLLSACSPALSVREPIVMRSYPADTYAESNLLVVKQVRMALPEGWRFKARELDDVEDILFFIRDTGSNTVTGALRYTHFNFPINVSHIAQPYADKAMKQFSDKQLAKTEIDGREAYVIQGTSNDKMQRISTLIQLGTQGVIDITLAADTGYFTREQSTVYTLFNSYQFVPPSLSERRIRGAFSFRCEDGSMEWMDDIDNAWALKGFEVSGTLADEYVVLGIAEVKTQRFSDFLKVEDMSIKEFDTEVHIAGKHFPAKAVGDEYDLRFSMYYLFEHGGKAYRMFVYRTALELPVADARKLHEEPEIRRALDTYFYFDS